MSCAKSREGMSGLAKKEGRKEGMGRQDERTTGEDGEGRREEGREGVVTENSGVWPYAQSQLCDGASTMTGSMSDKENERHCEPYRHGA